MSKLADTCAMGVSPLAGSRPVDHSATPQTRRGTNETINRPSLPTLRRMVSSSPVAARMSAQSDRDRSTSSWPKSEGAGHDQLAARAQNTSTRVDLFFHRSRSFDAARP